VYGDDELNALMVQVVVSNQNVAAALAQYRQTQALLGEARAAYLPSLSASLTETRARNSGAGGAAGNGNPGVTQTARAGLSASWEADVWGQVARSVESGQAVAQASQSDLQSALLSAQATLVQTWYQLRATEAQQALLERTVVAYSRSLEIAQHRQAAGVVSRVDVLQAEAQLRSAQAQGLELGVQRAQYEHAIAVLLGRPPGSFSVPPQVARKKLFALSLVPPVPLALPSRLLERRPDVAAAERRMAAANAQVGVAQAAWFPVLSFSATGGYQNDSFAHLLSAPHRVWSLGPALAMSLFDGGARSARKESAMAAYDKAVASYRQTVLTAFQEVEDNLATLRLLAQEAEIQQAASRAAEEALRLTENQYRAGTVSYLNVVSAQASAFAAQRNDISIAGRRLLAHAALLKALGGEGAVDEHNAATR
jgi:NodT family efflux transporter outer membrane factor (OMF) lipoprotein